MELVSIDQFSSWLKLEEVDQVVLGLHDEYTLAAEQMANEYNDRIINGYAALEDEGSWRDRRRIRREAPRPAAEAGGGRGCLLRRHADSCRRTPCRICSIRSAFHTTAPSREDLEGNWSLRGQTEAAIDIGEVIMAIDPVTLDEQTREIRSMP